MSAEDKPLPEDAAAVGKTATAKAASSIYDALEPLLPPERLASLFGVVSAMVSTNGGITRAELHEFLDESLDATGVPR